MAVFRETIPSGFDQYSGYDLVLYVNLTSQPLYAPQLTVTSSATSGADVNLAYNLNGSPATICSLPAGAVWATLVPTNMTAFVNASLNKGTSVVSLLDQPLFANANPLWITVSQPAQQVAQPIPSLQALAVSPDNKSVYGVNTAQGLLVVANAGDLTQRQTFTGIGGASAVVVSPDGKFVYVTGAADKDVAIFTRNTTTGDLTWQQAVSASGHDVFQAMTLSPSGDKLYVAGADGVESFQRNASTGALTSPAFVSLPNGIDSFTDLAVSRDGALLYAVSPSHHPGAAVGIALFRRGRQRCRREPGCYFRHRRRLRPGGR